MKSFWSALLLLPLFVVAVLAGDDTQCDLATVEKAFYCETDGRILDQKDLVSGATYYACEDCESVSTKAGRCESCDTALAKKTSGKDACPECFDKAAAVEVCVKDAHECPECGDVAAAAGQCDDCEQPRKKIRSRALVEYVCPDCSESSHAPGKCGEEECKGKTLVRRCSESGVPPHVKAAAGAKGRAGG